MSAQYDLPVDMSSKRGGLTAIAKALNEGDVVRAQVATVLLGIPHPPSLSKGAPSRQEMIELARELLWSGLLKADWDPDEHPRWPAGAPDSQGGQFAPKSDDSAAGQSSRGTAESQQPSSNNQSAPPNNNQGGDSTRNAPDVEDRGIYAGYGSHIGGAQVADASIRWDGLGIPEANPANWENITRLAGGALKLGSGQIIAAATLLAAMDPLRERARVTDAISKFDLDPTSATDVLAARAYVWAEYGAPRNYFDVPWGGGEQLESVRQSIMALELARPGTLYLALQGDQLSGRCINVAVEDGMRGGAIFESRPRPENLPAALQTTSSSARAALNLKPNDQMRAHHLIPANVWGEQLPLATLASQAGWQPDSIENLIALPANEAAQAKLAPNLPIHSSSHSKYDAMVWGKIVIEEAEYLGTPTPAQARAIFEKVAGKMRDSIETGKWMPRLH
ncbi:AHH domain-containing protein [Methylocapsa sp. S129]|uniref:AHH domain-containing protein n=1 Tax=Methylocapsa sp. S129 TaxID=1641869 RepID=UPI00131AE2E7|nr:AHH domain-containing protein [Methylocapsa sp. S129]